MTAMTYVQYELDVSAVDSPVLTRIKGCKTSLLLLANALSFMLIFMFMLVCHTPCGLQGCKDRPVPFPGQMSYKASFVLYLSVL